MGQARRLRALKAASPLALAARRHYPIARMSSPDAAANTSTQHGRRGAADGDPGYCGRFAPSPTGPLHFGSLVTAVGSYLQARSNRGRWLVRIEDIDPPREQPGAAADILRTLELFGFAWDGEVVYQSRRGEAYLAALERLAAAGMLYACTCSRKEIAAVASLGPVGHVYPGRCRGRPLAERQAWRVLTAGSRIRFRDLLQGESEWDLEASYGDFVVRRAGGLFAYPLASVVDDAAAGVTEVVRGHDLLACPPPQIHLQRLLGHSTPRYMHLPIALNAQGQKLSKQNHARPLDPRRAPQQLAAALRFLGQPVPAGLEQASVAELWQWAVAHWSADAIPRAAALPVDR